MSASDRVLLTPITAATTDTLPDCTGLTGYGYQIVNTSSFALTLTGQNSETITGSSTVASGTPATFTAELTSPTAGGCYWLRAQ